MMAAEKGDIPDINTSEFECQFEFMTQPKEDKKPFLDIMNVEKELTNPEDALRDMQFNSPEET